MAYIKDLHSKCMTCPKRASKEVMDRRNASLGKFCTRCAKAKLKAQLKVESQWLAGT